ncbi:hypothetical protein [Geminisphaera colitermitum]|uniref:hypothetical protein n=1 Tax=Geminisphaera colitermitum TaxID=1148786 RepID=UPI000158C5C6|nr:hypothetical protein [Geminisphaera colitermitum]
MPSLSNIDLPAPQIDPDERQAESWFDDSDWRSQVAELQKKESREHLPAMPVRPEVVSLVLELAKNKGCSCFTDIREAVHKRLGMRLSGTTVVNILVRHGARRGREIERMRMVERRLLAGEPVGANLKARALRFNPALLERGNEGTEPGEVLTQTMFPVEPVAGREKWHVHAVVDTFGTLAFGWISEEASTDSAVECLHGQVLPWYARQGVRIRYIETSRQRIYYSGEMEHVYGAYLRLHSIGQRVIPKTKPSMNGFMARFKQVFTSDWLLPLRMNGGVVSAGKKKPQGQNRRDELNEHLTQWLHRYNNEMPLHGYRNDGKTPMEFWRGGL